MQANGYQHGQVGMKHIIFAVIVIVIIVIVIVFVFFINNYIFSLQTARNTPGLDILFWIQVWSIDELQNLAFQRLSSSIFLCSYVVVVVASVTSIQRIMTTSSFIWSILLLLLLFRGLRQARVSVVFFCYCYCLCNCYCYCFSEDYDKLKFPLVFLLLLLPL